MAGCLGNKVGPFFLIGKGNLARVSLSALYEIRRRHDSLAECCGVISHGRAAGFYAEEGWCDARIRITALQFSEEAQLLITEGSLVHLRKEHGE